MLAFRLYGQPGCPHCETAEKFLISKGVGLHTQTIPVGTDPVCLMGIKAVLGGEAPSFPVLYSFITNEVVSGFKQEHYERLAAILNTVLGAVPPNPPVAESNDSGQAAEVVAEPAPAPEGAV